MICVVIILLILYYLYTNTETFSTKRSHICNSIDGRCYPIVEKYTGREKASIILAELNKFCIKMIKHLRHKYLWNNHSNTEAKNIVLTLLKNYNPDGIIENAPISNINTSYVDNKGRTFAICLREKKSGKNNFHNIHDLHFVVLHELSHMANVNFGHEQDFWEIFKFMLQEAQEAGLHEPKDYSMYPINYCSLDVIHNPYFDKSIRNIKK